MELLQGFENLEEFSQLVNADSPAAQVLSAGVATLSHLLQQADVTLDLVCCYSPISYCALMSIEGDGVRWLPRARGVFYVSLVFTRSLCLLGYRPLSVPMIQLLNCFKCSNVF